MSQELKKALENAKAALKKARDSRLKASLQSTNQTKSLFNSTKKELPEVAKKTLSKFGVKSFDELVTVNTADTKYSYISKEERDSVKSLKEEVDVAVLIGQILTIKMNKRWAKYLLVCLCFAEFLHRKLMVVLS